MKRYCKAYHLKAMRQFTDWVEKNEEQQALLSDDDIVYLWDNFTVVKSPIIPDKAILFDTVTPEWQTFCKKTLQFEIPEDLRYAYEASTPQRTQASEFTKEHSETKG